MKNQKRNKKCNSSSNTSYRNCCDNPVSTTVNKQFINRVTSRISGSINSGAYDNPTCKKINDLKKLIFSLAKEIESRKHLGAKDEYTNKLQNQLTKAEKELFMIAPSNIKVTTTRERTRRIHDQTGQKDDSRSSLVEAQDTDECFLDEAIIDDSSASDVVSDILIQPPFEDNDPITGENPPVPVESLNNVVELTIDPEIENVIPPLSSDQNEKLQRRIEEEGCYPNSIKVWISNGVKVIIDGHACYRICTATGKPFNIFEKQFASIQEAKIWRIENHVARRNMNSYQLIVVGFNRANIRANQAKLNQLSRLKQNSTVNQNSDKRLEPVNLTDDAAKFAGVSYDTASRVSTILKYASDKDKKALSDGEKSINEVFLSIKPTQKPLRSVPDSKENVVESRAENHQVFQPNTNWNKLPIKKLRELKVKELIDENTVLFICTKSTVNDNTVTAITSNRCATVKYEEWIRIVQKDHKRSTAESDLISLVQEHIDQSHSKKSKSNDLSKKS